MKVGKHVLCDEPAEFVPPQQSPKITPVPLRLPDMPHTARELDKFKASLA